MAHGGRIGGQVVSALAFYSGDLISYPAEVYIFSSKLLLQRTKIAKIGQSWCIFNSSNPKYLLSRDRTHCPQEGRRTRIFRTMTALLPRNYILPPAVPCLDVASHVTNYNQSERII